MLTRRAFVISATALAACGPEVIERNKPGVHELKDRIHGKNRVSLLFVPPGLDQRVPVLVGLHDNGSTAQAQLEFWRSTCEARSWVGVFPVNLKEVAIEDNAFFAHLFGRVVALGGGDATRVFLFGQGAGAARALAMAAGNPKLVRAVAHTGATVDSPVPTLAVGPAPKPAAIADFFAAN